MKLTDWNAVSYLRRGDILWAVENADEGTYRGAQAGVLADTKSEIGCFTDIFDVEHITLNDLQRDWHLSKEEAYNAFRRLIPNRDVEIKEKP
jgi:glycosylphosphatidylinositol transamidase (GPIT) subunit GPI8